MLDLRKLASVLVDCWMATIRSQSVSGSGNSPAGTATLYLLIQIVYVFICVLSHWLTKKIDFFRQEKEERGQQGASTECEGTEWRRREEEGETKGSRTQPHKDSLHR